MQKGPGNAGPFSFTKYYGDALRLADEYFLDLIALTAQVDAGSGVADAYAL